MARHSHRVYRETCGEFFAPLLHRRKDIRIIHHRNEKSGRKYINDSARGISRYLRKPPTQVLLLWQGLGGGHLGLMAHHSILYSCCVKSILKSFYYLIASIRYCISAISCARELDGFRLCAAINPASCLLMLWCSCVLWLLL